MSILGLPDYQSFKDSSFVRDSHRRRFLLQFPQGKTPLTTVLSMLDNEPVDAHTHIWYPEIWASPQAAFRGTNPITSTAPTTGDADDGTNMTTGAKAVTVDHYIKVDTVVDLVPGMIIRLTGSDYQFRITEVTKGAADEALLGYIKCLPIRAYTAAATDDATGGIEVIGTAAFEGGLAGNHYSDNYKFPFTVQNQTTINFTQFEFSRSVLRQGLEFDKTGPYKKQKYLKCVDHMVKLEKNLLFSQFSTRKGSTLVSGEADKTLRTGSGILEFLQLWDAGSTGLQINGSTYAPFAKYAAATTDADDRKRIIENTDGTITRDKWNIWSERVGRYNSNNTSEKLVLCGSTAINAMHKMFSRETTFNVSEGNGEYGLDFVSLRTPYGKFQFVMHPLLNESPITRSWALILDIHSMKFRPFRGGDTELLKMIQNPGDELRIDKFRTEWLLEMWFPTNNMLIKNINSYSVS